MRVHAVVTHEPPWYVARCVGADVAAQGATADEATANLKEALAAPGAPVSAPSDPPVVTSIEIDAPVVEAERGIDPAALRRQVESAGWAVVERGGSLLMVCPFLDHQVFVPREAREVAPGVYRVVTAGLAHHVAQAPAQGDSLTVLDGLFERHPHDDDTTRVIRDQRDAG